VTRVDVGGASPLVDGACRVMAEAGANHNNSVERAIEMSQRAAEAGAWGIKFQLYKADTLSARSAPKYWTDDFGTETQHEAFQLSDRLDYSAFSDVADACSELGVVFFATPFDAAAIEELERLEAPIYKIASGDITNRPLLELVADTGKPVLLSTGASTPDEIERAIEWLGLGPERLVLLACTLTYPTPDEDGHFARIASLRARFPQYLTGMSDHTLGTAGAWMTAALGGVCIEKHYTIDKKLPDVPDHAMSVDPEELAEMVRVADRAATLRGSPDLVVHDSELPARENARRSIVLTTDGKEGEELSAEKLAVKRPGSGLPPFELDRVIGRRLTTDLPADTVLTEEHLA